MSHPDGPVAAAYQRAESAAKAQRRLATVRGTGTSDDGLVTAVVSGAAELLDLRIEPEAIRLGPIGLGDAIVAAAWRAGEDVRQRAYAVLALAVGDEATAELERLDGPVPARGLGWDTAPTTPAPTTPAAHVEEQSESALSFDPSIFRSDR